MKGWMYACHPKTGEYTFEGLYDTHEGDFGPDKVNSLQDRGYVFYIHWNENHGWFKYAMGLDTAYKADNCIPPNEVLALELLYGDTE